MTEMTENHFPVIAETTVGTAPVQTVNARDLHGFLKVGTAFKDWIARRLAEYGFQEGRDFCSYLSESSGGRPSKEYALTLDMAKELSMVERTERGKQARQYFIECERRAKVSSVIPQTLPEALRLAADLAEQVTQQKVVIGALAPKATALDRIATADGSLCITDAAKNLQVRPKDLFSYLRSHGWIYKRPGTDHDVAYQSKLVTGVLEHKTNTITRADGSEKITTQVRVTPKGLTILAKVFGPAVQEAA